MPVYLGDRELENTIQMQRMVIRRWIWTAWFGLGAGVLIGFLIGLGRHLL